MKTSSRANREPGVEKRSRLRALLLGGSGLLSGAAREAFLAAGHEVTVLSRGTAELPAHPGLRRLRADRHDGGALGAALRGQRFDFTADFLAYDAADIERLLAAPGFVPGRLVMISSGQVYLVGEGARPPYREADAALPAVREPAPGTRDWREWAYGMGKRAAEAALARGFAARGVPSLALRLPVVQGEADGQASRRLWAWLERMRDGGPVLLPDGGTQQVRFIYAGDVAAALLRLAVMPEWPAAPALNLAQPGENTLKEFLELAAAGAGLHPRFVPVPAAALEAAGLAETCAPYWGRWCSRPDPSAGFAALGLRTRGPAEYLPAVVRAHLQALPALSHPGYALRAQELALAARLPGGVD
ncbi:MAG TPA: NAD-dependent epimerase/dehydratase family protein [Elusimicrobiales bacterium]|nr:NAD-dependent epimerase/dehydratase family protein [Elusimicrobiales bacterium]